jgi:predicted DNA-binding ribbon-helix-helix protein
MDKRSLSIAGHRTSIALEPEFWAALEAMAAEKAQPMAGLIRDIDENRQT